jgi:hypothetical protein
MISRGLVTLNKIAARSYETSVKAIILHGVESPKTITFVTTNEET